MSYIFEALQRAENERAGGALPEKVESVADLLQAVEKEIALKQAEGAPAFSNPAISPNSTAAEPAPAVEVKAEAQPAVAAAPAKVESAAASSFEQAKVLVPVVPADSRLICLTDQGGLPAEKFRMLGLKLRHLREKRKLKKIVVTGTAPEEGKSLVAVNLALNQSRSKVLKTLLVDGDLRRPTVAGRFGFDSSLPGLSECLRGERKIEEVVYKLKGSGLWFLPAGRAPENPLELMQGGKLPELLEHLGGFFDWIVIDTPPVVPVADTTFWMRQADGVLLVIREGVSEKKIVERAMSSFDSSVLLGVVVNSCSSSEHENYYSRYGQAPVPLSEAVPGNENEN